MRFALNSLSVIVPDWLAGHLQPDWAKRYGPRADDFHLPKNSQQRLLYAQQVGQDGFWLMSCLEAHEQAPFLWQLPGVDLLRRVWLQQFQLTDNQVLWRTEKEGGLPTSAKFISSPYDPQARYSRKNTTTWVGYKVHLSEICEPEQPHLITQVTTTVSTDADLDALPQIHQGLSEKTMLPTQHLVDTGYISAAAMTQSQQTYQVDLVGPARGDYQWQARAGKGFAATDFHVDWSAQQVTCPQGQLSKSWSATLEKGQPRVVVKFSRKSCRSCPVQTQCTRAKRRTIHLRADAQYEALQAARQRDSQASAQVLYAQRAGIEGTLSQGVRAFGMRRSRYIGMSKTHLQHVLIATAINLYRLVDWLNEVPLAKTRQAAFVRLMPQSVA